MKKYLSCTIQLISPVIISDTTGGQNHIGTLDYLPGASLLGVFAGRYIKNAKLGDKAHTDEFFYLNFLRGGLRFLNATLRPEENAGRSYSIPLHIEKYRQTPDDGLRCKYLDVFITRKAQYRHKYEPGYFLPASPYGAFKVKKVINFHTSRKANRLSGHAEEGGVFTYEAIAAGQTFCTGIIGEENVLQKLHDIAGVDFTAWLGRSKTAQYGQVRVKLDALSSIPYPELNSQTDFQIILNSPALIPDRNGGTTTTLQGLKTYLADEYGLDVEWVEDEGRIRARMKTTTVENYNRKWESKRWSENALAAGSVFSFKVRAGDADRFMRRLSEDGLGVHTAEGFGETYVYQFRPEDFIENAPREFKKPQELAADTQEFLKRIIQNFLLYKAELLAIADDQQNGKRWKEIPGSLYARLMNLIRNCRNIEEFGKKFTAMTRTERSKHESPTLKKSGENLKKVRLSKETWKGQTMFEIFSDSAQGQDELVKWLKVGEELKEVVEFSQTHLGLDPVDDREFTFKCFQTYWIAKLNYMRKRSQKREER